MSVPPGWPQVVGFFGTPLVMEPSLGQLSGDAGLIRKFDQRVGLSRAFAAALDAPATRNESSPPRLEMARARVYGILALGRRDEPAFRDRIVGVEGAGQEVARVGLFARSSQVKTAIARRSETPKHFRATRTGASLVIGKRKAYCLPARR